MNNNSCLCEIPPRKGIEPSSHINNDDTDNNNSPYLDLFKYWSLIDLIPPNDKQCSSKNISCLKENSSPEANSLTPRKAKAISTSCEKQIPQLLESEIHGVKSLTEGMIRKSPLVKVEE